MKAYKSASNLATLAPRTARNVPKCLYATFEGVVRVAGGSQQLKQGMWGMKGGAKGKGAVGEWGDHEGCARAGRSPCREKNGTFLRRIMDRNSGLSPCRRKHLSLA